MIEAHRITPAKLARSLSTLLHDARYRTTAMQLALAFRRRNTRKHWVEFLGRILPQRLTPEARENVYLPNGRTLLRGGERCKATLDRQDLAEKRLQIGELPCFH